MKMNTANGVLCVGQIDVPELGHHGAQRKQFQLQKKTRFTLYPNRYKPHLLQYVLQKKSFFLTRRVCFRGLFYRHGVLRAGQVDVSELGHYEAVVGLAEDKAAALCTVLK